MLFDIPFIADWQKIGEHRQKLTDSARENEGRIDYVATRFSPARTDLAIKLLTLFYSTSLS